MGTNNLVTKSNGEVINVTDPNQYKEALIGDIVPRNASGVPEAGAGDAGTSSYPFSSVYIRGAVLNQGTVTTQEYSSTDTWEAPDEVTTAYVLVCGAGGAGSTSNYYGGGGGGGAAFAEVQVVPGVSYAITISTTADFNSVLTGLAGGAGGLGGGDGDGGGFTIASTIIGVGSCDGQGGAGRESDDTGINYVSGGAGGTGYSGRGGRGLGADKNSQGGGGGGVANGANATSDQSGGGGGYAAASGVTGGAAGVRIQYYLPSGVVDPN